VRAAVIDSSPLINLTHLELAGKLALFFDRVYVPASVRREVSRKFRFRYRLNKLCRGGIFARCSCADRANVDLLRYDLDEGEAECLVQAQEQGASFFIGDERRAREQGLRMGLTPVGTARLLARLHLQGEAEETWELVRILRRDVAYRISDNVIREAIAKAPEPI